MVLHDAEEERAYEEDRDEESERRKRARMKDRIEARRRRKRALWTWEWERSHSPRLSSMAATKREPSFPPTSLMFIRVGRFRDSHSIFFRLCATFPSSLALSPLQCD